MVRSVAVTVAALLAAGSAHAASLETYSKVSSMRMPAISPDGSKLAFVQIVGGKQAVVIDRLQPAALIANIPPDDRGVVSLIWADDTHLVVRKGRSAQVVDTEKRKLDPLIAKTELLTLTGNPRFRTRNGKTVALVSGLTGLEGSAVPALELVDLASGREERLARAHSSKTAEWGYDPEGNLLYQAIYDQDSHVWNLQLRKGADWIDALSIKALYDPPVVVGRTLDGKDLVVQQVTQDHGLEFRSFSLSDNKLGDLVPQYSGLATVIYDPQSYLPIGGLKQGLEPTYVFFDPQDQAKWDGILKLFPGEQVVLESWTKDRSKVVVLVTGARHAVSYQLVDTQTGKIIGIGPAFDGLGPDDLGDVQIATYPAKDGLRIQGLLTLPVGRDPKNLPLVVLPHSGPARHDETGYNGLVQALASRGYAVLQPQFRGSSGLGWGLQAAGFGELGRKMQTDLSDGVRALASKGYVDPKRVCIVGLQGYGGYSALAGVILEKGVYSCAVAVEPWIDLRKATGARDIDARRGDRVEADPAKSLGLRYAERYVGAKNADDPVFDRLSPISHAADASAPILIMRVRGGGDDTTRMVNALKGAGKTAELYDLDLSSSDADKTSREMVQAAVNFVEKNNPPR